ncbi:hypothetical protein [Flavobacterium aquatile]|uniref:Uncharacterized protein n=1 Tax=Flavobacterium aquatile LMG 4008 = ATCC 11947 TaxID=1453498 RepID=A0A095STX2_9FLAO|nr:hypothetical protein [Flavobacterium aquatile]KGD68042.1 hypothetical protein LG45_07020 [Flavobacterium aquatile LMG 4008 = ATCC 11947]OXA68190.1 hypothetical protein B0A61_04765 [Flavobacterium aquatile LMG 4008 = ATCC 11947]GEC80243.1 hypothetical protein FAQ01_31130 [Flavobacterium aquatile]
MEIDIKLKNLRVKLRQNSKEIMDDVLKRHVPRISSKDKSKKEICVFCASKDNLTKEHVLPKWTFENCTKKFFVTDINGSEQTYNKTTIPVCANCNNNLLGSVESYIISIFNDTDLSNSFFSNDQLHNIIRWLEIIEYKFQLLEIRRKFIKSKSSQYIEYLRDIPVSIMRANIDYSPSKAVTQIRTAQKRVTEKSKVSNGNSLVIFKTKNESFYFFHHLNEFIFLELPKFGIALFYFYSQKFEKAEVAKDEALKVIKEVYNS